MEVAQATWNSQLDDLQSAQRSKYQEFILELYTIYKRRKLQVNHGAQNDDVNGSLLLDGKDMVAEVMRTIGTRLSNVDGTNTDGSARAASLQTSKDLPAIPPPQPPSAQQSETEAAVSPASSQEPAAEAARDNTNQEISGPPPMPPRKDEDPELSQMIKSILEMGFDIEQAKGALVITNRDMVR